MLDRDNCELWIPFGRIALWTEEIPLSLLGPSRDQSQLTSFRLTNLTPNFRLEKLNSVGWARQRYTDRAIAACRRR
jgi:hypothetical protein